MIKTLPQRFSDPIKLAALGGLVILSSWSIGTITNGSPCPFYRLTGLPCPGCGGTRAVVAFFKGDLQAAASFNLVGGFFVITLVVLWLRWLLKLRTDPEAKLLQLNTSLIVLFTIGALAWWIFRLTPWGVWFRP